MAQENTAEKQNPDLEDDDDKPAVVADPEGGVKVQLGSRKERREARNRERYDEMATQLRQEREQREQLAREMQELRAALSRPQPQQYQPPPQREDDGDPYKREINHIRQEQESIQLALRSQAITDPGEIERLRKRFYDLEEKRQDLREERLEQRITKRVPQAQPEGSYEEAILRSEFGAVIADREAARYAYGLYNQMAAELAKKGEHPTLETSREAFRQAGERFGILRPSRPAASPAQQARYGAVPAQAGARSTPREMRLSREQMKLATAAYPHLSEEDAYSKWAQMYQGWERRQAAEPTE